MRLSGLLSVVGATGSRVVFSALFTLVAAHALQSNETAYLMQVLLIQTGLIAFMSASSFARASYVASLGLDELKVSARSYIRFLGWSTVVATPLMALWVPGAGVSRVSHVLVAIVLVFAAAATAINSFLQGFAAVLVGRARAFRPSLVASVMGLCAVPLIVAFPTALTSALVWAAVQVVTLVLLVLLNPQTRAVLLGALARRSRRGVRSGVALIGVVNALYVVALVLFRESWAGHHEEPAAEAAFTAARLFELVMQVTYMLLASSPGVVSRAFKRLSNAPVGLYVGGPLVALLGLCPLVFAAAVDAEVGLLAFLGAEMSTLPARLASSACLVLLLHRTATGPYSAVVGATAGVPICALLAAPLLDHPYAIQLVQGIIASVTVLVTLTLVRHRVLRSDASPAD